MWKRSGREGRESHRGVGRRGGRIQATEEWVGGEGEYKPQSGKEGRENTSHRGVGRRGGRIQATEEWVGGEGEYKPQRSG